MKFRTIIFAIQLPLLWCCASQAEKGNVVFETAADASALTDVIKSIEIISLEKTNGSAVGPARNTEVCLLGRDYIVADRLSSMSLLIWNMLPAADFVRTRAVRRTMSTVSKGAVAASLTVLRQIP